MNRIAKHLLLTFCALLFSIFSFAQTISSAEYFFNTDPGFGAAIPLTVSQSIDGVSVISDEINTSALTRGFHRLFVRTSSSERIWSQTYPYSIWVDEPTDVNAVEYFFDTDPGLGNGTSLAILQTVDGVTIISDKIKTSDLSRGIHRLFVRACSSENIWTQSYAYLIWVEEPTNVNVAEYFFDTDPGFGEATPLTITQSSDDGIVIISDEISTSDLEMGLHRLFVRTRSSENIWSESYEYSIWVNLDAEIEKIEYYWDTDPGLGLATSVPFTQFSDNVAIIEDYTISTSDLSYGQHYLNLRSYSNGVWSILYREEVCLNAEPEFYFYSGNTVCQNSVIFVMNTTTDVQPETTFHWDMDGDGTEDLTTSDQMFTYTYTKSGVFTATLTVKHDGLCEATYTQEITVNSTSSPTVTLYADDVSVCAGTEITFTTKTSNVSDTPTYEWYVNDVVIEDEANDTLRISTLASGDKVKVKIITTNTCASTSEATSSAKTVTIYAQPEVTLTDIPLQVTTDAPFTLTNGSPSGGVYYIDGVVATFFAPMFNAAGTYTLTYEYVSSYGCSGVAETTISLYEAPTSPLTLSFDANGGDETPEAMSITFNTAIGTLPTVTRSGYSFVAWKIGDDVITDATVWSYVEDQTAVAEWSVSTNTVYTVLHKQENILDNSYTLYETENLVGTTASEVTPTTKSYVGFNSPTAQTATISADGTTVVEYEYSRTLHTVTYVVDAAYGSTTDALVYNNVKYGASTPTAPTITAADGYKFTSWTPSVETTVEKDATYTAQFTYATYSLLFDVNGGATTPDAIDVTYNSAIGTLPTVTRSGYDFVAWKIGTNVITAATVWSYTENQTAVAEWSASTNTAYTVLHKQENILDNSYTLFETENLVGTTASEVTPTTKSYVGFNSPTAQTVTISADGTTVVEYEYNRTLHTVTYVVDAAYGSTIDALVYNNVKYGASTPTAPTITAVGGYLFAGWNAFSDIVESDATYTAQFTYATYVLSFDENGGDANPLAFNVTFNSAIGTLPTVTRSGYSFVAWKIGADVITDATVWSYTSNQTAVAEWKQSVVTATDEVSYQDLVSVYPNPANEYIFVETDFDVKLIRIYDTRGALINSIEPQGTKTSISVTNLTDGLYIIEIVASDNKVVRTKFIKK